MVRPGPSTRVSKVENNRLTWRQYCDRIVGLDWFLHVLARKAHFIEPMLLLRTEMLPIGNDQV
jgi:hypothetical protein